MRSDTAARPAASTAASENTGAVPIPSASAPRAGPSSAPTIAAPIAVPMSSPRRAAGDRATSHASAPAHEQAPPTPCMNRATSRTRIESATPKTKLEIPRSASPSSTVAPDADARGQDPGRDRADQRARRVRRLEDPGPVFEMPCSSAYVGSSGVIAL